MAVVSKEIYRTQSYCEKFLGFCPIVHGKEDELRNILDKYSSEPLWDYPLDEIDEIVENNLYVVLVDVSYINDANEIVQEYRWFEVPSK